MGLYSSSQAIVEYVGLTGSGIVGAAQGLQRTVTGWVTESPFHVAGAVALLVLLLWLTRSHAR